MSNTKIISAIIFLFIQFNISVAKTEPSDSTIVKILPLKRKEFLFTKHSISERKSEKIVLLASVKSLIRDAVEYRDTLWIGTAEGLYSYSIKTGMLQQSKLLSNTLNISKIKLDAGGSLWIASINDGLWRIINLKAEKFLDVSPVYSLEISSDSTVWAGSNIGLYKLNNQINSWQRFAEEGYSGYEIPDNIVENLFCDLHNNTWVIMPDEFAFIRSNDYEGHVPGFKNMIAQDFELKFITEIIPNQYVFITSKGIFLMPNPPERHSHEGHEIKENAGQKIYLLTNQQLLLNDDLDTKSINAVNTNKKGDLLIAYNDKIYCIKKKTIKKVIKNMSVN